MSTLTLGGVALPSLPPEGAEMAGVPAADRQALAAVPQAAPAAGGILVDQPRVLARPTLPGTPGGRRPLRAVPRGPVPPRPAADLYLLASVLHDWDDDHGARILTALSPRRHQRHAPADLRD